jgi:hypothetical protein
VQFPVGVMVAGHVFPWYRVNMTDVASASLRYVSLSFEYNIFSNQTY